MRRQPRFWQTSRAQLSQRVRPGLQFPPPSWRERKKRGKFRTPALPTPAPPHTDIRPAGGRAVFRSAADAVAPPEPRHAAVPASPRSSGTSPLIRDRTASPGAERLPKLPVPLPECSATATPPSDVRENPAGDAPFQPPRERPRRHTGAGVPPPGWLAFDTIRERARVESEMAPWPLRVFPRGASGLHSFPAKKTRRHYPGAESW